MNVDNQAQLIAVKSEATLMTSLLSQPPAMASSIHPTPFPTPLRTMSNKLDAAAKDAEGKIQSAVGSLTGDKGQQLKGEAKQVQADVMQAEAKVKEEAKKAARKLDDATD
ncbi:CsbD family protein [Cyanobium gracile]|uniref:CsbD family protein n=1 Tax=Cyanobium gracile UHCC 0281 TaxID=3110309 RepID=A0ABU5SSN5_9CYAN|nr:CsbD family protein [Cyanobium gracile]MEA5441549.1 CsbD family protein [Cyanobium gracile UHCC 0281]